MKTLISKFESEIEEEKENCDIEEEAIFQAINCNEWFYPIQEIFKETDNEEVAVKAAFALRDIFSYLLSPEIGYTVIGIVEDAEERDFFNEK